MTQVTEKRRPLSDRVDENKEYLNDRLGVGTSFDIGAHEFFIGSTKVVLYYINGFADSHLVSQIMRELNDLRGRDVQNNIIDHLFYKYIPYFQLEKVSKTDEFMDKLLVGQIGLIIDHSSDAIIMDAKVLPVRSPQEPDTERIVRGAHDGFTEVLVINTVLTRRRIRDERLRFEIMRIGERTKTDVAVAYLQDVANEKLVDTLKERLQNIQIDGIPMAEKTVEEFIIGKTFNPFPLVRYTERPDVAAVHLLEGHVLIYVDNSPSVMITPSTYFHHVQHAEEYRQTPVVGAYLRWVRFFGIFASIFVLPIWLLLVMHPSMIPEPLHFLGIKDKGSIPLLAQFLMAEVGLDLMRMAAIHTPAPLSIAMGLLAATLVGDIAIKVGLFAPEVILYLAIAAVGMYATPSYELSLANRLVRIFLILMVGFFSTPGLMIGFTVVLVGLATTRSLDTPYLWPFIPFNYKAFKDIMVRIAAPSKNNRPSIVRSQNSSRQ
ncbi:stage V sporulation protein AF [Brevibacillus choshinensis]|uniref:Stage V sporulation protein AF n=1 Tax=Brevibacillus choshinensis TaxID=54911 RepID=A0ABR5NCG1_BRECH|nr:spore germination protein [Brevibacillus choshinensis]KQL49239.1 stage V sporulation protein AF [Brevibacillus choshinensis]